MIQVSAALTLVQSAAFQIWIGHQIRNPREPRQPRDKEVGVELVYKLP
jgi:hypothetical protein